MEAEAANFGKTKKEREKKGAKKIYLNQKGSAQKKNEEKKMKTAVPKLEISKLKNPIFFYFYFS